MKQRKYFNWVVLVCLMVGYLGSFAQPLMAQVQYVVYEGAKQEGLVLTGRGSQLKGLFSFASEEAVDEYFRMETNWRDPYVAWLTAWHRGALADPNPLSFFSSHFEIEMDAFPRLLIWVEQDPRYDVERFVRAVEIEQGAHPFDSIRMKRASLTFEDYVMISWQDATKEGRQLHLDVWHRHVNLHTSDTYKQTWIFKDLNQDGWIDAVEMIRYPSQAAPIQQSYFIGDVWIKQLRAKYRVLLPQLQHQKISSKDMGVLDFRGTMHSLSWRVVPMPRLRQIIDVVESLMKHPEALLTDYWSKEDDLLIEFLNQGGVS